MSGAERVVLSTGARYGSSCDPLSLGLAFTRPALTTPRALSSALTTLRRGGLGGWRARPLPTDPADSAAPGVLVMPSSPHAWGLPAGEPAPQTTSSRGSRWHLLFRSCPRAGPFSSSCPGERTPLASLVLLFVRLGGPHAWAKTVAHVGSWGSAGPGCRPHLIQLPTTQACTPVCVGPSPPSSSQPAPQWGECGTPSFPCNRGESPAPPGMSRRTRAACPVGVRTRPLLRFLGG